MSAIARFSYAGKRAVVVGAATGMGAAVVELVASLGAEVVAMDIAPIAHPKVTAIALDLSDQASIDAAAPACGGPVDSLFLCAGVGDGTPGIERINYVGHRALLGRFSEMGALHRGSAICFISSAAGLGWEANFTELIELLTLDDFDLAASWMRERKQADYYHTKQAVCAYVAWSALEWLKRGIRINAVCPGPTDTPLANAQGWLHSGADYRAEAGIEPSRPESQAFPMLFLNSDAASAITGVTLLSDLGWLEAGNTGSFPSATPMAAFLYNRPPASGGWTCGAQISDRCLGR